ncbi:unnamed protein product [Calypogeia fissa]
MASSEADGHTRPRPSVDEEEPPTKQLKLCVEDYQITSPNSGGTFSISIQSATEENDGVFIPDHPEATLDNVSLEDGSNLVARVENSQVSSLEVTKPEELSNSGTLAAQITELDASPMVSDSVDSENVGGGEVAIAETDQGRVQMAENEETPDATTSEVLEGNGTNGLHVSGLTSTSTTGVATAPIVGLPLDLGAGTSAVQRTKTSLCSYFRKKGCRHGAACRYAHGEEELKPRPDGSWDPTSERAKALLLQKSAVSPAADPDAAEEVPTAPVKATVREGTEESTVNPLSKCIIHVPRGWSVDHFKKFLTENSISYTTAKKRKGMSVAFVGFKTPEDVVRATEVLDGKSVNKKQLKVAESRSRSWEKDTATDLTEKSKDEGAEAINDPELNGNGSDDEEVGDLELAAISREGAAGEIRNVCDAVTPLADKPYEEQLSIKRDSIVQVLKRLVRNTRKGISSGGLLPDWISSAKEKGGLPCALDGVLASPLIDGYRNKCEFSIGCTANGERVVGFQVGSFREGMLAVAEPTDCRNVSAIARAYAAAFQDFVRQSELPVWNKKNNSGFWRLLIVREGRAARVGDISHGDTSSIAEVMLVVQVCPNGIEEERRTMEYEKMTDFLVKSAQSATAPLPLTALLVQDHVGISNVASPDAPLHPLLVQRSDDNTDAPKEYIHDYINNLQFRISPTAFFQVNTLAAERLYSLAGDWAGLTPDTLLFDVCCGTGTIGLTLAHRVGLVVGIEMNASAVADAQKNAEINNITNCRFVCSKAEDVMDSLLKEYLSDDSHAPKSDSQAGPIGVEDDGDGIQAVDLKESSSCQPLESGGDAVEAEKVLLSGTTAECEQTKTDTKEEQKEKPPTRRKFKNIVAIVDPPRVGLHPVVLKTLRLHTHLRRLVYISCNPQSLLANAVELCAPLNIEANAEKGKGAWRGRANWKGMSNVGQARQRVRKMPPSEPFNPVKAIAVDLFPHTVHCEMVMLFER